MSATLPPFFNEQFFDVVAGVVVPAAGYKLYTYATGTTTNKTTYTDAAGLVPNANPITLDSAGRVTMFLGTGDYTFVLKVSVGGATVKTWDSVTPQPAPSATDFLPLDGSDDMTGPITLPGNATSGLQAVPLQQVNSLITTATSAFATSIANAMPIGSVIMWLSSSAPTGFLEMNGAAISRTTYADLYDLLGTTYGSGDGSTTFNLPECRGEFPRFYDNARGIDSARVLGSSQTDLVKAHTHSYAGIGTGNADGNDNLSNEGVLFSSVGAGGTFSGATASNTGAENRPRNVAFMGLIKAL
jgi:microcystin-dependent protein